MEKLPKGTILTRCGERRLDDTGTVEFRDALDFVAGKTFEEISNRVPIYGGYGAKKSTNQGRA